MQKCDTLFFQEKGLALFSSVLLVILSIVFFQEEALAVPIFARKYATSCTTCHVAFPKLNAFGEAFKTNGYRLPNDEVFVKEPPVWLGSEAYKRVWPNAVYPGAIPGNVPISLRMIGQGVYDRSKLTTSGDARTDFEFPHEIELNSLGTMGDNLSFDLDYAFQDENERSIVERVFLGYNDILAGKFGIPRHLLNMRLGLIDPMVIPFSMSNQRLTTSRPTIYNFRISSGSQPRLTDSQTGIELFGVVDKRFRYAGGVVNGVVRDGATEAFTDNNSQKDGYARAEYKFGGLPFTGEADSDAKDQLGSGFPYFDQGPSLTLGSTGYYGINQIDAPTDTNSEYHRILGFARANYERYNVDAVYLYQLDDAAAGQFNGTIAGDENIDTWGFYVEGSAVIYPWMIFVARYDRLNIEHITILGASNPRDSTSRLTLSLPVYARPNLRIVPEISVGLSDSHDANASDSYLIRLDFAY
ncbi:MAG: hypothetical protein AUJ71_02290 [Candidatus Omnitrophica bacterium CG1_02_49_16]|nr:MAG: hypothetical protein AUJ71_02290 [Candidatus Omnitrophica bacterium CG1_02_49_16]